MKNLVMFAVAAVSISALAGCVEDDGSSGTAAGNSAEAAARQACLNATIRETGNRNAAVARSEFSEAGTEVIVVVGNQQAAWQCIAYRDGSTTRPMSLTNEGTL